MTNGIVSVPGASLVGDPFGAFQLGRSRALGIQQQRQQLEIQQAEAERQQRLQELRSQLGQAPVGQGAPLGARAQQPVGQAPQLGVPAQQPAVQGQQLGFPAGAPQLQQPGPLGGQVPITPIAPPEVSRAQLQQQFETEFPEEAKKQADLEKSRFDAQTEREKQRFTSIAKGAAEIQGQTPDQQIRTLKRRKERLIQQNLPTETTDEQIELLEAGRIDEANARTDQAVQLGERLGIIDDQAGLTAAQREFAGLTEDLTAEQKKKAKLIELGLSPRAVGSAVQTISAEGLAEEIGNTKATIKEREKFGELTGSSRAKAIDSGFERIVKIDQNILNLDKAIAAVEAGAGTGAIERRFPSIKAASVELDQIQGELALDVIGAVTFGALSEGELALAKQIALPTGLEGPQLIQHLRDRQSAQQKLRSYFNEQIDFLDQGGSVAGFLRNKERQIEAGGAPGQQPAAQAQQRNITVDF